MLYDMTLNILMNCWPAKTGTGRRQYCGSGRAWRCFLAIMVFNLSMGKKAYESWMKSLNNHSQDCKKLLILNRALKLSDDDTRPLTVIKPCSYPGRPRRKSERSQRIQKANLYALEYP